MPSEAFLGVINATLTNKVSEWRTTASYQTKISRFLSLLGLDTAKNLIVQLLSQFFVQVLTIFFEVAFLMMLKDTLSGGGEYKESWPWPLSPYCFPH